MTLPQGRLGYAIELERPEELASGEEPMMLLADSTILPFNTQANPADLVTILNQANQGACQGHALAMIFQICMFLATGRIASFSRAAAYYLSQKKDGIRGDRGSTLSGGRKVALEGLCLEKYWPYPNSYNPARPASATEDKFLYKLRVTSPFTDVDAMKEWMLAGLPIQTGIAWGNSCNNEIVSNWSPGGGGHSTTLWLLSGDNVNNINSWGKQWNGDGVHKWTWGAIAQMLRHQHTTFIGYSPDNMEYPEQEVL